MTGRQKGAVSRETALPESLDVSRETAPAESLADRVARLELEKRVLELELDLNTLRKRAESLPTGTITF